MIVFYHKSCADGFCAAWAAWKSLGDSAEYIPVQYSDKFPDMDQIGKNRRIYVLDFCFPIQYLKELSDNGCVVTVLDHHKTALEILTEENIRGTKGLDAVLDMNRSGAGITFDYFNPGSKRPSLVDTVEDRDLWKFKKEHTKTLSARLALEEFKFDSWDHLICNFDADTATRNSLIKEGELLLKSEGQRAESSASKARLLEVAGYSDIPVLNTTDLISETGEVLNKKFTASLFSATFFVTKEGFFQFSLRTNKPDFDVSAVAKRFGGGGHRGAAGFRLPFNLISSVIPELFSK